MNYPFAWFVSLVIMGLIVAFAGRPPLSTTFTVNSLADATDANPGDGLCETAAANGLCTLRAAIQETNALAGLDTIILPAGLYPLTLAGSSEDAAATGDLDITGPLLLEGAGAAETVLDGNRLDRLFHLPPLSQTITVTLRGLTMQGGRNTTFATGGGALLTTPNTTLSLESVILYDNESVSRAGAIYNQGILTMTNSQVISNTAEFGQGGGILNDTAATLTILRSHIGQNLASHSGGGIYSNFDATLTTIHESTIAGNTGSFGGGIMGEGGSVITLVNSTVSGNQANMGGGFGNDGGNVFNLINTTVTANEASMGGGVKDVHGNGGNTFNLTNSIIAGNTAFNAPDCDGPLRSLGHSLVGQLTVHCFYVAAAGDLVNTNPQLGPLQHNGGSTLTHALLSGSPAIDAAGNPACPPLDQRGAARPVDGNGNGSAECDMGAYEYNAKPATPTPSPTPSQTPTASPTPTITATPSPTATPTTSPSPTAAPPHRLIYLPIIIR